MGRRGAEHHVARYDGISQDRFKSDPKAVRCCFVELQANGTLGRRHYIANDLVNPVVATPKFLDKSPIFHDKFMTYLNDSAASVRNAGVMQSALLAK